MKEKNLLQLFKTINSKKINLFLLLFLFLRVGERWKKKAKKGLSSVGKLFRIMSRAALCSAELYSTYFLFSKNVV
jgi:hypothetical protein